MGYMLEQFCPIPQTVLNPSELEVEQLQRVQQEEITFAADALNALVFRMSRKQIDLPILEVEDKRIALFDGVEGKNFFALRDSFKRCNNILSNHAATEYIPVWDTDRPQLKINFLFSNYTREDILKNPHWKPNVKNFIATYFTFHPERTSSRVRLFYGASDWRNPNHNQQKQDIYSKHFFETLSQMTDSVWHLNSFDGAIIINDITPRSDNQMSGKKYVERYERAKNQDRVNNPMTLNP